MSGVVTRMDTRGSSPVAFQSVHVMNAAAIRNAPCAMLITFMTPKISVSPEASSAYTPPIRRPRITVWSSSVIWRFPDRGGPGRHAPHPAAGSARRRGPVGLDHLVGRRGALRQHDLRLAVLPLADQELALRAALLVPAQRSEDRVDLVVAQPVGHLLLARLVDLADGLGRRLHHLRRGVGVRGVLGDVARPEHLRVPGDELLVARRARLGRVADGVEDALGRVLADALEVLLAERRRAGLEEHLGLEADLVERADEADAVG